VIREFAGKLKLNLLILSVLSILAFPNGRQIKNSPEGSYIVDAWNADTGLPQNSVLAIRQAEDGYLWIATFGGLARFDGINFTTLNLRSLPSRIGGQVSILDTLGGNRLLLGTDRGEVLILKDSQVTTFDSQKVLGEVIIQGIFGDPALKTWITTESGAWVMKDGLISEARLPEGAGSGQAVKVFKGWGERIWLVSPDNRMICLDDDRTVLSLAPPPGRPARQVTWVWEESAGKLWIGTESHGLYRWEDGRWDPFQPGTILDGLNIIKAVKDASGVLWIGTAGQGLFAVVQDRILDFSVFDALAGEEMEDLFIDREGSVWIGLSRGGMVRLKPKTVRSYSIEDGLSHNTVYSVCPSPDGGVWIATTRRGVSYWENGVFTNYAGKRGFPDNVNVVYVDRAGQVWIGSRDQGLFVTDGKTIRSYDLRDGLPHLNVHAIYEDRRKRIWIGTENGLCTAEDGVLRIPAEAARLSGLNVISLLEDRQGTLWAGTDGQGICSLRGDRLKRYAAAEGLPNAIIRAIYEDRDGVLWLGTYGGGLIRFKDGSFQSITTAQGLFDDIVSMILEDGGGSFWMSCNRGIFRADRRELNDCADGRIARTSCLNYGRKEGMKSEECNGGNQPSGCLTGDGYLIVPTFKGIAVLDTAHLRTNTLPPPVSIESILADGRNIPPKPRVVLPAGTKRIEIRFAGLSFVTPEKVLFRYRLEGFDGDWLGPSRERTASYTSIPPRSYLFRLTACNNDGVWNNTGVSFQLEVLPYFYQRAWFYAAGLLSLVLLGAGTYRVRVRRLRKRQIELERLVGERTRLLTGEIAERKRVGDALRESEEKYRTIIENSKDVIMIIRPDGSVSYVSPSLEQVLGLKPEEMLGPLDFGRIHPEDRPILKKIVSRALNGEGGVGVEYRARTRTGHVKWLSHSWSPVVVGGRLRIIVNFIRDVTYRRLAHERIRNSLQEKEVMLKEIHHRVKNNMQVISSMLSLQAWAVKDRRVNRVVKECQGRIRSMALVHEKLYESKDLAHIGFAEYLKTLIDQLIASHKINTKRIQFKMEVEPLRLNINAAVPCGLIVNELLTNALKHAFPGKRSGQVVLRFHRKSGVGFVLEVRDTGIGLPKGIELKAPKTLGLRIVFLLVGQIEGKIECIRKNGTTFRITFSERK
jgi:PAS domain S-box-containing protein